MSETDAMGGVLAAARQNARRGHAIAVAATKVIGALVATGMMALAAMAPIQRTVVGNAERPGR